MVGLLLLKRLRDLSDEDTLSDWAENPSTWRVGDQLPRLWRNDWFLVRNGIEAVGFESLNPEGNSDHLVQSATLTLKSSTGQPTSISNKNALYLFRTH